MRISRAVIHIAAGIVTIFIFLFTGLYMRMIFPEAYSEADAIRYLYRANHVYILCSGLIHLFAGMYSSGLTAESSRRLINAGATFLTISTICLIVAFFREPSTASPVRPLTMIGIVLMFVGTLAFFLHQIRERRRNAL